MTKNDVRTFCHVSLRFHKTHTQKNPKPSNGYKIFTKFKKCLTKEHSLNFLRPDINFGHFCCCNEKNVVFFYDYCCCYIFIFSYVHVCAIWIGPCSVREWSTSSLCWSTRGSLGSYTTFTLHLHLFI